MKKRGKWIVGILIFLIAIISLCYYEVYISYNKITENNYSIENKKISNNFLHIYVYYISIVFIFFTLFILYYFYTVFLIFQ